MKTWIINPYGNLPGEGWRAYRSTMIAEALVEGGHDVVWWVSNFEHRSKTFRTRSWNDLAINEHFLIRIVPSTSYASHISLARIRYERNYARNVQRRIRADGERPDLIVLAEPAPFTSGLIMDVVRSTGARLVVDVIDLWPELFAIALPCALRPFSRMFFAPLYWRRAWLFRQCDALLAVSRDYLGLASSEAPRLPAAVVYLGIDLSTFGTSSPQDIASLIPSLPRKLPHEIWIIYAGTLGENYDLRTVLRCAERIQSAHLGVRFIIAGQGPLGDYVELTIREKRLTSAVYIGAIQVEHLRHLYAKCDMALSSYVAGSTVSMPVKAFDYLAAGLPLINSLGRDLGRFVQDEKIGLQYKSEDPDDLFRVVSILAQDHALRKELSANALELAKEFDTKVQYKKIVPLFDKLRFVTCT